MATTTMKMPVRMVRSVPIILVMVLILVACGSADDSSDGTTASTAADGGAEETVYDSDVQAVFDEFVSVEMPGVTIDLVQAAKDEGTVVYYTGFFGQGHIDGFRRRFPFVPLDLIQLTGGPLAERFGSEKQAGVNEADVYTAPESGMLPFIDEGYCEEYTPTSDADFLDADKFPGLAYRWGGGYFGIGIIPERLEDGDVEALRSWQGIADPRFAGRVWGTNDNPSIGTSTFYGWSTLYNNEGGELMEDHAAQAGGFNLYGGATPTASALLLGEIDFGVMMQLSAMTDLWHTGAPVGWITPVPLIITPNQGCIASEPPHPSAAKLLWEYILSDEGQLSMLPATHSYKQGLDFSKGIPEALTEAEWFEIPDTSNVATLSPEQLESNAEQVFETYMRLYAGES